MKCPDCGQWNRASVPRCVKCGRELGLTEAAGQDPSWRGSLKDSARGTQYFRMDENGESDAQEDRRDRLAEDMAELKVRKARGAEAQQRIFANSATRGVAPSGINIQVSEGTDRFWRVNDDPAQTVRHRRNTGAGRGSGSRTVLNAGGSAVQEEPHWDDSRSFDPLWAEQEAYAARWSRSEPSAHNTVYRQPARRRFLRALLSAVTAIAALGVLGLCIFFGIHYFQDRNARAAQERAPRITGSMVNDLAAHTILIPGDEGAQIYIRELHNSYIVMDGYASIVVEDHIWYDELEEINEPTMTVTLTPFLKSSSGRQVPMDEINYEIEIPISPIELTTPDSLYTIVSSSMYTMKFVVRPGSKVTINDVDFSDTIKAGTGEISYNATVQPSGNNEFNVVVRSQYCRENRLQVILYREPQEIPLDLAADTYTSTSLKYMQVNCTTLPGATVDILSPHSDLDISNLNTTGAFSFYTIFDHIGDNVIQITASFPGKKTSEVNYTVHYVPPVGDYTSKAWPLNNPDDYAELVSNILVRAERTQVYVLTGTLQEFVSEKPQMAVFNTSADGQGQPVLVQNDSKTTWEKGKFYTLYADAYSTYNGMPWLIARFTYGNK